MVPFAPDGASLIGTMCTVEAMPGAAVLSLGAALEPESTSWVMVTTRLAGPGSWLVLL